MMHGKEGLENASAQREEGHTSNMNEFPVFFYKIVVLYVRQSLENQPLLRSPASVNCSRSQHRMQVGFGAAN
jgi:hypothetical protein